MSFLYSPKLALAEGVGNILSQIDSVTAAKIVPWGFNKTNGVDNYDENIIRCEYCL